MKEYSKFFKDKSILAALFIILLLETSMQFGCYKIFQKKNSYAYSVNKITDHAINHKADLDPDILILGSSIAYEGISSQILNDKLKPLNLKAQSIAISGSELIVQELALEKALKTFKNVKYIIHVNDVQFPWIDYSKLSDATLSMISELDRVNALLNILEYEYEFSYPEISFVLFRFISYRRDIGDFILNPDKRIKDIGKRKKETSTTAYNYENSYLESLSLYSFKSLDECVQVTLASSPTPTLSNPFHKDAIYRTCKLASSAKLSILENENTKLYYKRLTHLYAYIRKNNIKIINVFAPLPTHLDEKDYPERIKFWKTNFKDILGERVLDLSTSLPVDSNAEYYYDLAHMNKKGMEAFSEILAKELLKEIPLLEEGGK
jgi:hypothetical protein